ncbi:hypothetical protein COT98_02025 [Candidatus Falkowbacteria bacterium CG10_big_fil_rev_8_21_14_0_10_39_9]|uniref:Uncharacterized protein n=1 Tax=Candidatus Falkowbacteria bacterium CG10_big_fil_rev_8_21_14_0_10_39_9 TaxID=1974566 RepID=A0A2M6WPW4_9BACT|nr:MAG: hypothetical protein COT98_02025 [Candidatus Falkowbacteria bacterium CG10_big_fil_rev_8_21_14_0_10_39_9]
METLKNELRGESKFGGKNIHHFTVKEKTHKQKHLENLVNRILNNYFGILVVLTVVVILVASFYLLIWPKYEKIVASINATFYERNQLSPKYKELSDYQTLIEAYKKVNQDDVKKIQGLVPKEYIKEDLFTEMIYLASSKGLAVTSLNIVKDSEAISSYLAGTTRKAAGNTPATSTPISDLRLPSGVGSFNVKIVLGKVTYPALKAWLQTMENSLRVIDVKSLSFDPKTDTANLEMTTYYLKK